MNKDSRSSVQYCAEGGNMCPNCGSEDIEAQSGSDFDGDSCSKPVMCNSCHATWDDVYVLSGYDNLQVPTEGPK